MRGQRRPRFILIGDRGQPFDRPGVVRAEIITPVIAGGAALTRSGAVPVVRMMQVTDASGASDRRELRYAQTLDTPPSSVIESLGKVSNSVYGGAPRDG
jgi:hypothetical protein